MDEFLKLVNGVDAGSEMGKNRPGRGSRVEGVVNVYGRTKDTRQGWMERTGVEYSQ